MGVLGERTIIIILLLLCLKIGVKKKILKRLVAVSLNSSKVFY